MRFDAKLNVLLIGLILAGATPSPATLAFRS